MVAAHGVPEDFQGRVSSAASDLLHVFSSKDTTVGAAVTRTPTYAESDRYNGILARLVRLLRELHLRHNHSWRHLGKNPPSPFPDLSLIHI